MCVVYSIADVRADAIADATATEATWRWYFCISYRPLSSSKTVKRVHVALPDRLMNKAECLPKMMRLALPRSGEAALHQLARAKQRIGTLH
jgi:hypothetical protein